MVWEKVPNIKYDPPGPKSMKLWEKREKFVARGISSTHKIFIKRAKNGVVEDVDGNVYIDFAGGIGTLNAGHLPDRVVDAVIKQLDKYIHTCFMVIPYEPYVALAEKLAEITPSSLEKSIFLNSGAEAVENAVKIANCYKNSFGVIVFDNAFHGRTQLTMNLTAKVRPYKYRLSTPIGAVERFPFPYCYRCPFGINLDCDECTEKILEYISYKIDTHIALEDFSIMLIELVQGESGFIVAPKRFVREMSNIARENGLVFAVDEVQTGFGRTAKMFAFEHYDITPDLLIFGKSIASGFPLAGVIGRKEIMDSVHEGGLGSTFGGNPIAAVAALETIDIIREYLPNAEKIGKLVSDRFNEFVEKYEIVGDARGLGAMNAIELVEDRESKKPAVDATKRIIKRSLKKGLILIKAGILNNVIRVLVPITVDLEIVEKGLDILEESIREELN